jgi:hypothetical protein
MIDLTNATGETFLNYFQKGFECQITCEQWERFIGWAVKNGVRHKGQKMGNLLIVKKI